ncbi:ArsR/SmtB family transcription factor [Streptococcus orisasini]
MIAISQYKRDAQIFKALADEKRLQVLDYLQRGETCACVLIEALDIPQSALSYHMKILCQSGLVTSRQEGKWKHYSINRQGSSYAIERLEQLTLADNSHAKTCHCQRKSS